MVLSIFFYILSNPILQFLSKFLQDFALEYFLYVMLCFRDLLSLVFVYLLIDVVTVLMSSISS